MSVELQYPHFVPFFQKSKCSRNRLGVLAGSIIFSIISVNSMLTYKSLCHLLEIPIRINKPPQTLPSEPSAQLAVSESQESSTKLGNKVSEQEEVFSSGKPYITRCVSIQKSVLDSY